MWIEGNRIRIIFEPGARARFLDMTRAEMSLGIDPSGRSLRRRIEHRVRRQSVSA